MKIEIDQSRKIEDTSKPTIIALTNTITYTIKVSAKTKRQIQEIFGRKGEIQIFIYRTFAVLVFLLIRKYISKISVIIIDTEYPGHENLIRDIILDLMRKIYINTPKLFLKE